MILTKRSRKIFLLLTVITIVSLAALYSAAAYLPLKVQDQADFKGYEFNVEFSASPNPFDEYTVISIFVDEPLRGSIVISDDDGNVVNNLFNGSLKNGFNNIYWYGQNDEGLQLPRGRYSCELIVDQLRYTSRTIILILK